MNSSGKYLIHLQTVGFVDRPRRQLTAVHIDFYDHKASPRQSKVERSSAPFPTPRVHPGARANGKGAHTPRRARMV